MLAGPSAPWLCCSLSCGKCKAWPRAAGDDPSVGASTLQSPGAPLCRALAPLGRVGPSVFVWGILPGFGAYTGAVWLKDAAGARAALRRRALLLASNKSRVGIFWRCSFLLLFGGLLVWSCMIFSVPRCRRGVLGMADPAAVTAAPWRCVALSPWPQGQGGTQRWHHLPPPPPPPSAWERCHLAVSAQAPGKVRGRVCPHGRASKPSPAPRAAAAPSRIQECFLLFLPLCAAILLLISSLLPGCIVSRPRCLAVCLPKCSF